MTVSTITPRRLEELCSAGQAVELLDVHGDSGVLEQEGPVGGRPEVLIPRQLVGTSTYRATCA